MSGDQEKMRSDEKSITGAQIRGARALLDIRAEQLAEMAKLGTATIWRAEKGQGIPPITRANLEAIRRALEDAGIEFIDENGHGPGVRFRDGLPSDTNGA